LRRPTFLTWLWNARGGWRSNAGYTPQIIAGVQYMLAMAVPGCRHVCIADEEYHAELRALSVEPYPLWDTHGRERGARHGFDCHARIGLWGEPGARLAEELGTDIAQWVDADVMIKRRGGNALIDKWEDEPERFWVPRSHRSLDIRANFGSNVSTWLGVNGSMVRLKLGSRPDWWERLADLEWVAETEARICGSDQAAITRLLLEEMGEDWREPTARIFDVPKFGPTVVPYGQAGSWDVAFFPYDPFTGSGRPTDFTKPWLTNNAHLSLQWRILAGMATEAEQRMGMHPLHKRRMGN
jgi:hypothetical protein